MLLPNALNKVNKNLLIKLSQSGVRKMMKDLEQTLYDTDFSKDTDLKSRLAARLFGSASSSKVRSIAYRQLTDEETELVNAAQGIWVDDKDKNLF